MLKYIIKVVTTDGSKLTWNAYFENERDSIVKELMKPEGYYQSTEDYGKLLVNRKNIVAIEVHEMK
ncbi:hypothetical protein [Mammaliicoccus sciuri]|uniref:hypothetical protein n=1 Tax=Mammaliicoccus sciuri TaxID=1296 RepID=UPI0021D1E9E3|nr:hypothetical protein [Mammaliicoccus sciuri]MEB6232563.1 hypothetical protein [Mammaliicoccus sciuri]UXU70175.1 hypothetical protein MUA36_05700 [Mammaliicoccus sciuri]